ncbi:MAG: VC2662 family protein [Myxococcota bacterium]
MKRLCALLFGLLALAAPAAADAPFQFHVPNFRTPDDPSVNGVRLSLLHGRNENVRGFDLGVLALSDSKRLSGLSVTWVSRVRTEMAGGAAVSFVNYHSGRDTGLNAAFINKLNNTEKAFNVSFLNIADDATAVDLGGLNMSDRSVAQIGFLNITRKIEGFQFGFLNIAENGFLPVFPVFNFAPRR